MQYLNTNFNNQKIRANCHVQKIH